MTSSIGDRLTDRFTVRRLLQEAGVRPSKRLGQSFLVDGHVVEAVRRAAADFQPEAILEIGPGLGVVTRALATLGVPVEAIEIDPRLVDILRETTADLPNVRIRRGDALATLFEQVGSLSTLVAGSIPYRITAPLLQRIVEGRDRLCGAVLVTQREVADKVLASPSSEGSRLGVFVRAFSETCSVRRIGRGAFLPAPDVESTLWTLRFLETPRFDAPEAAFFRVVRAVYGQRRKMIRVALRSVLDPAEVVEMLEMAAVEGSLRGEGLGFDELDRLARVYHALSSEEGDESCQQTWTSEVEDDRP